MTPIPDFGGNELYTSSGLCFTPSNTAKQNYMYLNCAGARAAGSNFTPSNCSSDSYMLLYTYSGTGELEYMNRRFAVNAGEGFLIDCRQPYSYRHIGGSEPWEHIWFNMSGSSFAVYYNRFAAARKPVFPVTEGSELDEQLTRLAKVASRKSTPQSELIASTAIICILTQLVLRSDEASSSKRAIPAYIDGIMERINSGYTGHITLDSLAAEFNVSKFHLSREFKKYTGYSPNEYLISVRINRAKELLRHTNYSVGEISQMTGCGDVNHFIQLFKSREKTTPAAFRRHWQDI